MKYYPTWPMPNATWRMKLLTLLILGSVTYGCAVVERGADYFMTGAEYYCKASPEARELLRQELTTSKGPVIQVNCENLE